MVICDICGDVIKERIGEEKPREFSTLKNVRETCRQCASKISTIECKLRTLKNKKIGKVNNDIHAEFNKQVEDLRDKEAADEH